MISKLWSFNPLFYEVPTYTPIIISFALSSPRFNPLFYEVPTYTLGIKKEAKRLLNVLILYSTRFLLILQRYGLFISLVQVLILYSTRFLLILLEFCCKSSRVWWVLILYSTRFLLIPASAASIIAMAGGFNPLFYEVRAYTCQHGYWLRLFDYVLILYSTRLLLILSISFWTSNSHLGFNPLFYEAPTYTYTENRFCCRRGKVLILYSTRLLLIRYLPIFI